MAKSQDKKVDAAQKEPRASALPTFLFSCLLFLFSFLYLWLVVEPHLIYYSFGTILPGTHQFASGWSAARDALGLPGGLVAHVAAFFSLGFHQSWLGAGVIVLAGLGLAELTRRHLVMAGLARASIAAFLPAVAFFLIYSDYKHPLPAVLAISSGLLLSLLFERRPLRRSGARLAGLCLMAAVGFWLGGPGALLVFAIMTVLYAAFLRRDWPTAVLALPAAAAVAWLLAEHVFLLSARQIFLTLAAWSPAAGTDPLLRNLTFLLYGFTPLACLLVLVGKRLFAGRALRMQPGHGGGLRGSVSGWQRQAESSELADDFGASARPSANQFAAAPQSRSRTVPAIPRPRGRTSPGVAATHPQAKGRSQHVETRQRRRLPAIPAKVAVAALPTVLMILGLYFSRDDLSKPHLVSNTYWHQKRWDKILELAQHLPKDKTHPFVNHDILRAMYHTGRLPYDLFRFPLVPEGLLLTHETWESDLSQLKLSDLFLELGHINMAQKLASELVATKGNFGPAIEEMAWISIVKGQPSTARVYLEALRKDPIRRGTAESLLHGLDSGFTPQQVDRVTRIRSYLRDETAGVTGPEPVDQWLAALVERNPQNRMAFEYLMTCYLLTGRVEKIAENVKRMENLGYRGIPTLYEEALVIHYGNLGHLPNLARIHVSRETAQRYQTFLQLRHSMQPQNQQAVLNSLIRDFGASYFFYYSFGRVGVM